MQLDDANHFGHILYEIEMYIHTFPSKCIGDSVVQNMMWDSHAIYLRNLACFFFRETCNNYWHATNFVSDNAPITLLENKDLFRRAKRLASGTAGHLNDERLSPEYKARMARCYEEMFPIIVALSESFLQSLSQYVIPELRAEWEESSIQKLVHYVCKQLHSVSGACHGDGSLDTLVGRVDSSS